MVGIAAPTLADSAERAGAPPLSVAQLLARHPFPEPWAHEPRIERLWVFEVKGTPEALWPHLADTSRMNRALGTAEMRFEERDGKRWGSARDGGVRHAWIETPWNWIANQWLTCLRIYERGFMRAMFSTYRSPSVADYLAEQGAEPERLSYSSTALPEPVGVRRWSVYKIDE